MNTKQTFICPQCGWRSTYDPWVESARCPKCGYTPTADPQALERTPLSADQYAGVVPSRRDPLIDIYLTAKENVPNVIVLVRMDDALYTFEGDAQVVLEVCGTEAQVTENFEGVGAPKVRIPFDRRDVCIARFERAGHHISIAQEGILTCPQCGHKNRTRDVFFPSYECSQCGYVPPERGHLVQSFIEHGIKAVKAEDWETARVALTTALQHGGTPDQQASALLWLAEATPGLYDKRHYLAYALSLSPHPDIADLAQRKLTQIEAILESEGSKHHPIELPPDTFAPSEPPPSAAQRFSCPQCGGQLRYETEGHSLACPYCGYRQLVSQTGAGEATAAGSSFVTAMTTLKGHAAPVEAHTLACSACGATFVLAPATLSLTCPYCATPLVVEQTTRQLLIPPTGLIVFTLSQPKAAEALREWLREIPTENVTPPTSLYLPTWTFNLKGVIEWSGDVWVGWSMARLSSYTWRRDREPVSYNDILIPASRRLPATLLDEMVDFDLSQLVPYNPHYLADWAAALNEVSMADAAIQARGEATKRFEAFLTEKYRQIKHVRLSTTGLEVKTFRLILLPVWIAHYAYQGTQYPVVINGQRGTVVGQRPRPKGWR